MFIVAQTPLATPSPLRLVPGSGRSRFGLFEFDPRAGELQREGRPVKLSPQPARVLALLLSRPGEVVLREEFREHLWGSDTFVDFERGLNFCILQVRTALGDSSDNPRFVQTVPRRGARFIAPVTPAPPTGVTSASGSGGAMGSASSVTPAAPLAPSAPLSGAARAAPVAGAARVAPAAQQWRATAALAAVSIVVVAAMAWLAIPRIPSGAGAGGRTRLVVLPITPLQTDEATGALAEALTDEIISELGQLSPNRLAVIARTSSMAYRGQAKGIAEIGRELDVSLVVESSLRREGNTIRLGIKLIGVTNQTPSASWEETFDVTSGAGPTAATRAAIRMSRLVGAAVLPLMTARRDPPTTGNTAAWASYMRGRSLMNGGSAAHARQAIGAFEAATAADPNFAGAWAKRAEARHLLVMMGADRPLDAYVAARDEAARAVAADPTLADAHLAQGLVSLWFDWNPGAAASSFERALRLNDSLAAAHHDYAWSLLALGRDVEAIAEINRARDLDPLSVRANNDIGWLYLHLRRPADAERACEHTLAVDQTALEAQACLERSYSQRSLWDAALNAARATMPVEAFATIAATGPTREDAMRALWTWRLQRLEQAAQTRWISPYTLAVQYVLVGDHARAIEALERARADKAGMLAFAGRDPALDPLRGDPRFRAFLESLTRDR